VPISRLPEIDTIFGGRAPAVGASAQSAAIAHTLAVRSENLRIATSGISSVLAGRSAVP
jgi:hypothetical protein